MPLEPTQRQSPDDQRHALEISKQRLRPPAEVSGYQLHSLLGSGAYGEVWVGSDRNTGRRVAIKFFAHRSGLDWPLLSREVEKLVFLSADRYVVQLLEVGWEAEPPYYVMEYVENGSLADRLERQGPLPPHEAVDLFREIVVGLVHAHGRGVLHCDLKPANILLDQDHRPRLADFGQSRMSHEQTASLGTLFFMAPEQADLESVPDASWDVYALGAILYTMLTGEPPHRSPEALARMDAAERLEDRLACYRELIGSVPPPVGHRQVEGVDRALADIVDQCLSPNPALRYANPQRLLDALDAREQALARRPLVMLGFVGPLLLLLTMTMFGWRGYQRATRDSVAGITHKAQEANRFAARAVAGKAAEEIGRYFRAVELAASDASLRQAVSDALQDQQLRELLEALTDPNRNRESLPERRRLAEHPLCGLLHARVRSLLADRDYPQAASWFICDPKGTQLAVALDEPDASSTVGWNFSWRTYFHGGADDLLQERSEAGAVRRSYRRPPAGRHITTTHLSAPFQSRATNTWKVAVSAPVYEGDQFLGVVALTVDIERFVRFEEGDDASFAVLVDGRPGNRFGMILSHPLYGELLERDDRLPDRFSQYRVPLSSPWRDEQFRYEDPLGRDPEGPAYAKPWIAAVAGVDLERGPRDAGGDRTRMDTGLKVLVQSDYRSAIEPVQRLGTRLVREGLAALSVVLLVIVLLWFSVLQGMGLRRRRGRPRTPSEPTPRHDLTTLFSQASPRQ